MKKLSILLLAFVAFSGIYSCSSDDDVVFIAQPDPEGINFTNSFNANYILTPGTATNVAERFVWNSVDFETPTNITYEIQGSTDTDFTNFDVMGTTGDNSLAVTVQQMMNLAKDAGLDADPTTEASNSGELYFRVIAYAGDNAGNSNAQNSEVKSVNVLLPEDVEEEEILKNFFMVGDAVAAGWSENNNNTPLFRDGDNPNLFHFTGRFAGSADAEGFKLLEVLGSWQPQWGLDGTDLSSSDILGGDPSAFPVTTDAYFTFTMDIDEMTWSFDAFDESGAATYDVIGLVGAGTSVGWPGDDNPEPDVVFTQSDFDEHIWYAQGVELTDGEVKFRADLKWDVSWGGGDSFPSGTANNDNIMAQEGTYNVWFNDITGRYNFIAVE